MMKRKEIISWNSLIKNKKLIINILFDKKIIIISVQFKWFCRDSHLELSSHKISVRGRLVFIISSIYALKFEILI